MVHNTKETGQTLIEILIAITITTLVLVTIIAGLVLVTKNRRFSTLNVVATKLNQESLEWLRNQRDIYGWQTFYTLIQANLPVYCLSSQNFTLQSICNLSANCASSPPSCGNNALLNNVQQATRTVTVTTTTGADGIPEVQGVATITWNDGNQTHTSEARLNLRQWQ